ncbi:MAG: Alpha/beta hydrolase [Modestobacter sp.]|nr:Alpha/beta hydrolase [Modestobacter sp.]
MTVHRRLATTAGTLLAVALALTGCTSSSNDVTGTTATSSAAATPAAPEAQPIDWSDCSSQIDPIIAGRPGADRGLTFQCGKTSVPVSYADPGGGTLQLFLVKATLAGQTNRIGSLLVNPGGPGQSATDAAIQSALTLPTDVLGRFDIVGVDPRGVGLSTPVECISDKQKDDLFAADPRATDAASLAADFGRVDAVADACAQKYKAALGAFNTVDTARDMDLVRQSLGDEKLTYLGYSYGTTLGSTYAELFPDKVRALVLDAAVDPHTDAKAAAEERAKALEKGFDAFAQNCVGLIAGCPIGADPRAFVEGLLAQAAQTPIPSSERPEDGSTETREATPGVVMTAVQAALSDTASWPQLAQALAAAQKGDSAGLFSLADSYSGRLENGAYSNRLDANVAINCADHDETFDKTEIRDLAAQWGVTYPLFGADSAVRLYTCSVWKADRTPLPQRDAEGSAPILVVGNTGDPVTPLPGAQAMADDLDSGVLLVWQGNGHTAYPKNECIIAAVNAYLIDLTSPMDGLTCPA